MAVRFPDPIHPLDPVELEINQLFDQLIMCVQQRRVALLTTYRDTRDQIAARPIARARKEEELIALKTETERLFQMNELRETQERILAELEQALAEVRVPKPETRVVFRGTCGHLEQVIAGVGEVVEEEVPVVPRYEEMRPIVSVGKKGHAPGELWYPHGVAIDRNTNLIYVAESSSPRIVSIFSETGEFLNTFTNQDMNRPWGIAIHRDNLYVTDTKVHAVFQFKIEADMRLVSRLGSMGSGRRQFDYPSGLSVSTKGDVFVADYNNNRIQVLDDSLHFQRSITHQAMKHPWDVKLTPDEMYVLAGIYILVLTYTGDRIRSFDTQLWSRFFPPLPNFFCLDAHQNIIVRDWFTHDIRILTKEGTLLHTIQKPEGGGYLCGIALTNNLNIVTVYRDALNQLIIFSRYY